MDGLAPFDTTPQTIRRAMTPEEIERLLKACAPHRKLLYQTALLSGLRKNELRNLTIEHLDQQDRGLHLDPAWTKNRKPGFQSLPGWLVEELYAFVQSDEPNQLYARFFNRKGANRYEVPKHPLLYVPSHTARALDADLKAAGIPKHGPGGKIDFHASRTAYINLVLESQGITPKEAQELARHGTLELTMNVYGRVRQGRLAHIVEDVGEFLRPKEAEVVPGLYRQAVGAEQESATPLNNRELHSLKMVEAAGIEPEGTQSKHNAEPAQNRAKPEQNQALRTPISPAEHQPESTSLHFRDTNETLPNAQKLYGTTNPAQQPMPNDLARVVAAWRSLSDDQKAQILAIVGGRIA